MLIEFRVSNFRSFREEQVLSLVASKDKAHPDNLIPAGKFSLLKSAAIFGLNASGKSNLVKAFEVMESFVEASATKMNQGDRIEGIVPFLLDAETRVKPSSFEVTAIVKGTRFNYGFSATRERVHDEWLVVWPDAGRAQNWFERRLDPGTQETHWMFRGPLKGEERMLRERTRDNCLVLSRGAELNFANLGRFFLWFRAGLFSVDLSDRPTWLARFTAQQVEADTRYRGFTTQLLQHADLGIDGIKLITEDGRHNAPPVPGEATSARSTAIRSLHRVANTKQVEEFGFEDAESNGTQRLFALAGMLRVSLDAGQVLVVDELDCSMHPLLTRKVIELFQSPEHNKTGAQLIFATHDSTLMDPELFRRDQIWLTEKNQAGATQLFSLHDIEEEKRPRSTEAFQRNYLAGRYGGVPKFGPFLEDIGSRREL
ncbi:MAG: ATP-binding protein [Planctomycetes bacterium]|nr:ATP-binding protein [Planctomycetota bacterium]